LTGEGKYYDAIARITNALETFQNETSLPGMWPTYIDASGCKKPPVTYTVEKQDTLDDTDDGPLAAVSLANSTAAAPASESPDTFDENEMIPLELPKPIEFVAVEKENEDKKSQAKKRRQLEEPDATVAEHVVAKTAKVAASASTLAAPKCEEQGLTSNGQGDYTLGGMSDSTYEYLPKVRTFGIPFVTFI
jgi:mannosyl-oligosaccharide alpha-1,2-mannosidase